MNGLVVGMGEVGSALFEILEKKYPNTSSYDLRTPTPLSKYDIIHICFPFSGRFIEDCLEYARKIKPKYMVIHSTVPVGTSAIMSRELEKTYVFHSPVRGKHPEIGHGLKTYLKYLSFEATDVYEAHKVAKYFQEAGLSMKVLHDTRSTELMKLLALSRYGVYLAFAKEQEAICENFNMDYHKIVADFERTRNEAVDPKLKQPELYPFQEYVGGHCVVENMQVLLNQVTTPILKQAFLCDRGTRIWKNCNIYHTAIIGKGCSIGAGTEIGHAVKIGNSVRIGAMCFIPEGVTIEDGVFIAPKVTFSNDKYPPSHRKEWAKILVKRGATIGMGAIILPGVTIGENAVIGAGCVVTKDVPAGEVWYGNPGRYHQKKEKVYDKEA